MFFKILTEDWKKDYALKNLRLYVSVFINCFLFPSAFKKIYFENYITFSSIMINIKNSQELIKMFVSLLIYSYFINYELQEMSLSSAEADDKHLISSNDNDKKGHWRIYLFITFDMFFWVLGEGEGSKHRRKRNSKYSINGNSLQWVSTSYFD